MVAALLDGAEAGDGADVEHVVVERQADPRRIEIGAPGNDDEAAATQRVERLIEVFGPQIHTHGTTHLLRRAMTKLFVYIQ